MTTSPSNLRARVLLVDDSRDILELYTRLINRQPDMECVGAMESTVGLEEAVVTARADVAVIDLVGPGRDALAAIASTAAMHPACRLIAFSGHDDAETRARAAGAGAWTLVSKSDHPGKLVEEVRRAISFTA